MAPQKLYLHIGLHKTGTTYLQNTMRANRECMRTQNVEFPGGPGEPVQALAVWDIQGRRPRGTDDHRIAGMWNALVRHINETELPTALISEERLSVSTLRQAMRVVEPFIDSEVHIIVTARDIGRIAVSAWQEAIKNDTRYTWREFSEAMKAVAVASKDPARSFWIRQDLVKICETWKCVVPAERLHVVTVPPPGSSPELLLDRFASVVGFDPTRFPNEPTWNNETIGVAATEVLRRINERMGGRLNQRQYDRVVKSTLVPLMARTTEPIRFGLPSEDMAWANEHAQQTIEAVSAMGCPVIGDLDDLLTVERKGARRPDGATPDEVMDASLDALALLTESYAKSWWARRSPDPEFVDRKGAMTSKARALVFRSQRKAGDVANKNKLANKALALVLKARDRARLRARDKTLDNSG